MASHMVSSYNKRRPIQAMLETEPIDIASMEKARAFEWVGEPHFVETTDARRECFEAVMLDGVQVKVSEAPWMQADQLIGRLAMG